MPAATRRVAPVTGRARPRWPGGGGVGGDDLGAGRCGEVGALVVEDAAAYVVALLGDDPGLLFELEVELADEFVADDDVGGGQYAEGDEGDGGRGDQGQAGAQGSAGEQPVHRWARR
ncbi:hypothetical protein GCM10020000_42650 [Streptomyces olivoverticillatus]